MDIDLQAKNALLLDADTGTVIYEKSGHTQAYPGSMTKLATALYLLERKKVDLNQEVRISKEAIRERFWKKTLAIPTYGIDRDAIKIRLLAGEVVTLDLLLHGLLLASGCDAANAIAEMAGGTIQVFMDELNEYLQEIGCVNTHFTNPHGLHHVCHFSSAYDICTIMQKVIKNELLLSIIAKVSYRVPKTNMSGERTFIQSNSLILPKSRFFCPKVFGGKTGYHKQAGGCLVSFAKDQQKALIACVMGTPEKHLRFAESKRIYELAFG